MDPVPPVPDKTVVAPRASLPMDLFMAGDVVGQYKVERALGAGGMGVVYLVQHTALKKKFALKALPAKLAQDPGFVARFKREAEMLARLKHTHIVNVTDFGENAGRLYLVLEYVDGGSLDDWFKQHKQGAGLAPSEARRLVAEILDGLAHAHQAGIIHRDLKPANVLMEKTGEAKISDFGLARDVDNEKYKRDGGTASPFGGDSVTTTGAIVGTIDFMSPEARDGRPSDGRSDIYAIGVIACILLTGMKPEYGAKKVSEQVTGLDKRWDKFIETCLAKDPNRRYQTAAAALEALQELSHPPKSKNWLLPVALGVLALGGAGAWFALRSPAPTASVSPPVPTLTTTQAPVTPPPVVATTKSETVEPIPVKVPPSEAAPTIRRFTLTGLPAGAVVTYHDKNHSADATGRVLLALPPGAQAVHIRAPGYLDWDGDVGVAETETETTVPLQQIPPHAVRFSGLPPQAQVKIASQTATADASGNATLELRPGHYLATASAPKYESADLTLDIAQSTDNIPVEMKRLPPPTEVVVRLNDGTEIKFHWIPPGSFFFGSPQDEFGRQPTDLPRSRQEIPKGFYMAETEMTQRQHRSLTGRNPSMSRALGDETRPVEQVAWKDLTGGGGVLDKLNEALRRMGLPYKADLPNEIEWEYACRAGTDTGLNDGSNETSSRDDPALNALGFYSRPGSRDAPSPVAKFKPNKWGLYDMHGNVAEWTYGWRNPRDTVARGGNWRVGPMNCRSASRVEQVIDARPNDTMGYRLVLRPTEE